MSDVVILLGAGASVESGAPLMADFLQVADDLMRGAKAGNDRQHFVKVFEAIAALKPIPAQISLDTYNLESVFSAFEMGALVGRLGDLSLADIEAARTGMVRVITRTLQESMLFPLTGSAPALALNPTQHYEQFANALNAIVQCAGPLHNRPALGYPTVISLNYDLGLDLALSKLGINYTYGFEDKLPDNIVKVLKLHGSLNWGQCAACGVALYWKIDDFLNSRFASLVVSKDGKTATLPIGDHINGLRCQPCGQPAKDGPLLVPPTWNKTEQKPIRNVWRHAAKELSEVRYLFFIGYSFPGTDLYLRHLAALGLASSTRLRKVFVINPSPKACDVFLNEIAGPTLKHPQIFRNHRYDFSEGARQIPSLIAQS